MTADDQRWLDADELEAWIPLIPVLLLLPGALDAQLQRDSGLTFYEYVVLSSLTQVDADGFRMSELAAVTSGALNRLSQVVTRMEQRGWVARHPDPDDKRATRVVLLPEGRRVVGSAAPGHVDAVRRAVFDGLSPSQVRQLRRIALAIAANLTGPDALQPVRQRMRKPSDPPPG